MRTMVIRLEGRAKVAFNDGEKLDGFFKEGVLHGFARFSDHHHNDNHDDQGGNGNDGDYHLMIMMIISMTILMVTMMMLKITTMSLGSLTERVDCAF